MIHVKFDEHLIPRDLREEAERLTHDLIVKKTNLDRKDFIERRRKFWTRLAPFLASMSHQKCWYTELIDAGSYYHVDHFRPKSKYWWLAFKITNYRLSCGVVNVNKSDHFKLLPRSYKASSFKDDESIEVCLLLDPCNDADPEFLTFDENGSAIPACRKGSAEYRRVKKSIEVYHLNHKPIEELRQDVWRKCEEKVAEAAGILGQRVRERVYNQSRLNGVFRDIHAMLAPTEELSSVVRACLLKSPHLWARNLANRRHF